MAPDETRPRLASTDRTAASIRMGDNHRVPRAVCPDTNRRGATLLAPDLVRPWCIGGFLGAGERLVDIPIACSASEGPTRAFYLTADALRQGDPLRAICEQDLDPPSAVDQPAGRYQIEEAVGLFIGEQWHGGEATSTRVRPGSGRPLEALNGLKSLSLPPRRRLAATKAAFPN